MKKPARKSAKKKRAAPHRNVSTAKKKRARTTPAQTAQLARAGKARDRAASKSGVSRQHAKGRKPDGAEAGDDRQSREFPDAVYLDR